MQTAGGGGQALPCGIDLGNHSSKVGCLSRTGTQVIPNALSNRETPTLLSSGGGRRLAGEGALNQRTSNPAGTVWNIRALLGRRCSATEAPPPGGLPAGLQLGDYAAWQAFQLAPTAESGLAVQLESGALPLEGVAAACLGDCMATARLAASQGLVGEGVPLVALAAPAWGYTASQRAALVSAAAIAGIELAGVLSEPAAASLFYATERLPALLRELGGSDAEPQADETGIEEGDDDEVIILDDDDEGDGPEAGAEAEVEAPGAVTAATVLFVDIGHGGTSASIVRFDGEARTVRVLDVAGAEVGGRDIDVLLAERFVQIAEAAQPGLSLGPEAAVGGGDAARVARARARILTATDECKKVLSANDSDTTTLEELAEGLDVRCDTTREELEESITSSGLLAAILKPVEDVLLRSVAADESIDAVELFGGTARVPLISTGVSALATELMGAAIIRRSLNGSEAVARGCALYAAMALPTFNDQRRIRVTDTSPYDMALVLSAPPPPAAAAKGEAAKLIDPKAVPPPAQEGAVDKPVLTVPRGAALPTPIGGTPSARLRLSDLLEGRASAQLLYTNQDQLPPSVAEGTAATPVVAFTLEVADRDALSQEPAASEGQETAQVRAQPCTVLHPCPIQPDARDTGGTRC